MWLTMGCNDGWDLGPSESERRRDERVKQMQAKLKTTPMSVFSAADIWAIALVERTGDVVKAMVDDVYREARGEIVESKAAELAIRRRSGQLFKARLQRVTSSEP